jgi:hypothetical protein
MMKTDVFYNVYVVKCTLLRLRAGNAAESFRRFLPVSAGFCQICAIIAGLCILFTM